MSENHENQNYSPNHYGNPYFYYPTASQAYYPGYQYRQFPPQQPQQQQQQSQNQPTQESNIPGMLPIQQSYIENILRLNRGKEVTVYMTFEDQEMQSFQGVIEAAGRDHIILSDPNTGKRYLLLMVYLDYVTFDEKINYDYPFQAGQSNQFSNQPPR
ncbi:MAG TPA: spore coat protein GerQ [Pseudogracilibacillus sp.]|nr:spore coat protein GerQ [Pseudogracilibacillus sp.]